MDRYSRPAPGAASPSSPSMNPNRTNNPRETNINITHAHSRYGSDVPSYSEMDDSSIRGDSVVVTGPSTETKRKLDQIIQNLFTKAAIVILQSRMSLPTIRTKDDTPKTNKWFQIETDDTDAFREELRAFKTCGAFENRPPRLTVEIYLDISELSSKKTLVLIDEQGRQHDTIEALNALSEAQSNKTGESRPEIVLERWNISLKNTDLDSSNDYTSQLPTVYKKGVTAFRGLFTAARVLPAAKLAKSLSKPPSPRSGLKIKARIMADDPNLMEHEMEEAEDRIRSMDSLMFPIFDTQYDVVTKFDLGDTETPAGAFNVNVTYRNEMNFRVENAENLLSERFMDDEEMFQPTIGSMDRRRESRTDASNRRNSGEVRGLQTYGSMSTFHGEAPALGNSPISALRAARAIDDNQDSPPVGSLPIRRPSQRQRPSSIALDNIAAARKNSIPGSLPYNMFKAGSLSGTPPPGSSAPNSGTSVGSQQSLPRTVGMFQARNRSSLTAGMPSTLRGGPSSQDNVTSVSASSSPKPTPVSRFSSSFGHRRGRLSYGGTSRVADEEGGSSGKQSLSSSAQPGSGNLPENGGSSGSLPTDDDNISDFLKTLELNKNLPSFQKQNSAETNRRTVSQLNRFQNMRESNNVLTESISNSILLRHSSSTSSRQLSSVPPMVGGTSLSMSSSPGKPISPHTPHTPIVPSRLSANAIVDYSTSAEPTFRSRPAARPRPSTTEEQAEPSSSTATGATAIDIPLSPRPYRYRDRRSSSVKQKRGTLAEDDEGSGEGLFHRSISLGAGDREPPSLNDFRGYGQAEADKSDTAQPPAEIITERSGSGSAASSSIPRVNPAVQRARAGGSLAARSPSSSLGGGSGTESATREAERANRYSWTRPPIPADEAEDEYPLLFDMSELGRGADGGGRRSLEDASGGGSGAGSAGRERRWGGQ